MKPIAAVAFLVLALPSHGQQSAPKNAPNPSTQKPPLLSSQISGRDMTFITQTIDQLKTLEFLTLHASVAKNKELRDLGQKIARSVTQQSTVLSTLAEMRNVPESPRESPLRKSYIKRLADEDESRTEATITELLLATERELFITMKNAENSKDSTVRDLISNFLPKIGEHLRTIASLHAAMSTTDMNAQATPPPRIDGSPNAPTAIPAKQARPLPKVKLREF